VILSLGVLEKVKLYKARHLVEMTVARQSTWLSVGNNSWTNYIQGIPLSAPADHQFVKKYVVLLLLSLIIAPVTVSAANYLLGDRRVNWQTADRSSAGLSDCSYAATETRTSGREEAAAALLFVASVAFFDKCILPI
jgi:hypothetical protein